MLYIILNFEKNMQVIFYFIGTNGLFFFFFPSAILKYVPLNEGVQPAIKWHTDKMRKKFKKI